MKWFIRWMLLGGFALLLLFGGSRSLAQAQAGVRFLSDQGLNLLLPFDEEQVAMVVRVFNGSSAAQTITLDTAGNFDSGPNTLPPLALTGLPEHAEIEPGQVHDFTITLHRAAGLAEEYIVDLAAYSTDGSLDTLRLTIQIEPPPAAAPTASADEILPPYLEAVTLCAETRRPNCLVILPGFCPHSSQSLRLPPEYAVIDRQQVGQVIAGSGQVGQVFLEHDRLLVDGVKSPGVYAGKAALTSTTSLKVNLLARDFWLLPLTCLGLGGVRPGVLSCLIDRTIPAKRLSLKFAELDQQACKIQDDNSKRLPPGWEDEFHRKAVFEIYCAESDPTKRRDLLQASRDAFKANLKEAAGEAEKKKWSADGEEIAKVEGYLVTLETMTALSFKVFEKYQALKNKPITRFEQLPVAIGARSAIEPRLFFTTADFLSSEEQLKKAAAFLDRFSRLYERLELLDAKFGKIDPPANLNPEEERQYMSAVSQEALIVQHLLQRVSGSDILGEADLQLYEKEVDRLDVLPPPRDVRARRAGEEPFDSQTHIDELQRKAPAKGIDLLAALKQLVQPHPLAEPSPEELRKLIQNLSRIYWLASILIAALTGFNELYLKNPTFGSLTDYLNTFLWSVSLTAGLQIARQFLPPLKIFSQ